VARITLNVSKKLGLPSFGSAGASGGVELELPEGLLHSDPEAFHGQVRDAYRACRAAVEDELARLRAPLATAGAAPLEPPAPRAAPDGRPEPGPGGAARAAGGRGRAVTPATPNQVRAIRTIARRQHADLEGLLHDLGVDRVEALSLAQASKLIDDLKEAANV
jgi:hypothetical protein